MNNDLPILWRQSCKPVLTSFYQETPSFPHPVVGRAEREELLCAFFVFMFLNFCSF